MKLPRVGLLVLLSVGAFIAFVYLKNPRVLGANQKLKIDSVKTLKATGNGGTRVKFSDGETLQTEYTANAETLGDLQNSTPTTLASGDFDRDGTADLMAGYANEDSGFLTLHRGNEASIFPAGRDVRGEKISPFLAAASIIQVSERPDFIGIGDFNNDTFQDAVTAQNGGANLNYFKGDGRGNFSEAEKIAVGGKITAFVAGNLNRNDGTADLAVAVQTETGAKVLIYEGWQGALNNPKIELFDVPKTAHILQIVSLNDKGFGDLAIAAENELILLEGRDRMLTRGEDVEVPEAVIKKQSFKTKITAMTLGNFAESAKTEMMVLTEIGTLFRVAADGAKGFSSESVRLPANFSAEAVTIGKARVSASGSTDDLILIDRENRQIHIFGKSELLATFEGDTIAVLPMRLNKDGLDDLVFLSKNSPVPTVLMTAPQAVFTVNSTGLGFDATPGNGVCETSTGNGECTLQAAIGETNALAGADEIRFNLSGSAPFSIAPDLQFLRDITETVTLDATTQPGFNGSPIVEINGAAATVNSRCFQFDRNFNTGTNAANSVIRGFVINRFLNSAIFSDASGTTNLRIEGNYLGTDLNGTSALPNGGGIEIGRNGHTIGGTAIAARNVISGNNSTGIRIGLLETSSNITIEKNFIGTDKNGAVDLGNAGDGIKAGNIGGASAIIKDNVISGNGLSGVDFSSSTGTFSGLTVEGNFIGTDLTGNLDLGNDNRGLRISGYNSSRIGGTANNLRNIISGNGKDGIELRFNENATVQGNFIGLKADGTTPLTNDRNAVLLSNLSEGATIGGGTPVIGSCDAPCNRFGVSATGSGVAITNAIVPNPLSPQSGNGLDNLVFNLSFTRFILASLGIDLGADGRTVNDPGDGDTGPNNLQNHAEVNQCEQTGGNSAFCDVSLNSNTNAAFNVDFYLNSSNGTTVESKFLGTQNVTTNAQGNALFTFIFNASIPNGASVSAITRRISNGNTSEDSPPRLFNSTCTYQVTPSALNVPVEGGSRLVTVTTQTGCPWTAVSNATFITNVSPSNGNGSGTVTFNVPPRTSGLLTRTGTLTIAGQTVTVTQDACSYQLTPNVASFNSRGGRRLLGVTAAPSCQWTAQIDNFGYTAFPTSGTGNGAILITAAPNSNSSPRNAVLRVEDVTSSLTTAVKGSAFEHFINDGKADLGTYGASNEIAENLISKLDFVPNAIASWRLRDSISGNNTQTPFGQTDDKLVPGDYNADSKADLAVFRPSTGTWFIAHPTGVPAQNFDAVSFGTSTDIPVPNDYDGDGKTDIAVFRPSTGEWWIRHSSDGNVTAQRWGLNGDKPVSGFYDDDEKADLAVWRPSDRTWYILNSSDGSFRFVQFGLNSDKPVPGDYDGDFRNDLAVFRPATGEWFILRSSDNALQGAVWGLADDKLAPADFDGDLKTDIAVWRPGTQTWFILQSSNGAAQITQQGQSGDLPIQTALVPE